MKNDEEKWYSNWNKTTTTTKYQCAFYFIWFKFWIDRGILLLWFECRSITEPFSSMNQNQHIEPFLFNFSRVFLVSFHSLTYIKFISWTDYNFLFLFIFSLNILRLFYSNYFLILILFVSFFFFFSSFPQKCTKTKFSFVCWTSI